MATTMHFLELFDGDFGVNGGGLQFRMAEQLLDVADVGAAFEQVRRARVAQQVATALESRLLHPGGGHAADHVRVERAAVTRQE